MGRKLKLKPAVKAKIAPDPSKKKVLHFGCGSVNPAKLHAVYSAPDWQEVRMDSRAQLKPDIIGNVTSMPMIGSAEYHGVFLPHIICRYYAHQVPLALREVFRILKVGGSVLISVPDIQKIGEIIAKGTLEQSLFESPFGPVSALDMLYGFRPAMEKGDLSEAQKMAFTAKTLVEKLRDAGFLKIQVRREGYVLWAIANKLAEGETLQMEIVDQDINKIMRARDQLDKKPEIPVTRPGATQQTS